MNEFNNIIGGEPNLNLRHIIRWTQNKLSSGDFMIYKTANGDISLINLNTGISYPKTFSNLDELELYLKELKTDNNSISIRDEWFAYTP